MKEEIKLFCQDVLSKLSLCKGEEYGKIFCDSKREFFRRFQNNLIFSTRFGADFFKEVLKWLDRKDFLVLENPIQDEKLGEYDINFNIWLKQNRD